MGPQTAPWSSVSTLLEIRLTKACAALSIPSYFRSRSCPRLNAAFIEFKRRPIPSDAEERRSHEAAGLSSGDSPPRSTGKGRLMCLSSGRFRDLHEQCSQGAIIEGMSKLFDEMIAYNLPDHIKGLSFPPRVPPRPLALPEQSFRTVICF